MAPSESKRPAIERLFGSPLLLVTVAALIFGAVTIASLMRKSATEPPQIRDRRQRLTADLKRDLEGAEAGFRAARPCARCSHSAWPASKNRRASSACR